MFLWTAIANFDIKLSSDTAGHKNATKISLQYNAQLIMQAADGIVVLMRKEENVNHVDFPLNCNCKF